MVEESNDTYRAMLSHLEDYITAFRFIDHQLDVRTAYLDGYRTGFHEAVLEMSLIIDKTKARFVKDVAHG